MHGNYFRITTALCHLTAVLLALGCLQMTGVRFAWKLWVGYSATRQVVPTYSLSCGPDWSCLQRIPSSSHRSFLLLSSSSAGWVFVFVVISLSTVTTAVSDYLRSTIWNFHVLLKKLLLSQRDFTGRLGCVVVLASHLWSSGHQFDSRPKSRSTQPPILLRAGVRAEHVHLFRVAGKTVWSHMAGDVL